MEGIETEGMVGIEAPGMEYTGLSSLWWSRLGMAIETGGMAFMGAEWPWLYL